MKRVYSKQQAPRQYLGLDLYNLSACSWVFFLEDPFLIDMEQGYGSLTPLDTSGQALLLRPSDG
jgi:hypothetical protein